MWHGRPARVFGLQTRAGRPCHFKSSHPLRCSEGSVRYTVPANPSEYLLGKCSRISRGKYAQPWHEPFATEEGIIRGKPVRSTTNYHVAPLSKVSSVSISLLSSLICPRDSARRAACTGGEPAADPDCRTAGHVRRDGRAAGQAVG